MTAAHKDLSRKPLPFLLVWGLPILVLLSVNWLQYYLSAAPIILLMAGAYVWMGSGCAINARRCGRLHCYMAGPSMLLGGVMILLVGFGILDLGPVRVPHLSYATLALVAVSFGLEWIFGRYVEQSPQRGPDHDTR
mgnify:CR=1 FL=1